MSNSGQINAFFNGIKYPRTVESAPLSDYQLAVDKNGDGKISKDEWIQDSVDLVGTSKGRVELAEIGEGLYIGRKPGTLGKLFGKQPDFQPASSWVEVPKSGPVEYHIKGLEAVDFDNGVVEIRHEVTVPYLRNSIF